MEAARSSETSVHLYQTTRRHVPEYISPDCDALKTSVVKRPLAGRSEYVTVLLQLQRPAVSTEMGRA
jgi:hypothetical protein